MVADGAAAALQCPPPPPPLRTQESLEELKTQLSGTWPGVHTADAMPRTLGSPCHAHRLGHAPGLCCRALGLHSLALRH